MKLLIPILINCALVLGIYLADKHTAAKKLPYMTKQIVIGLLFGGVSAFASGCGVDWLGTTINVRDAAPMSAGLIFGAPAGIISGLIGGMYRWFSVYWGGGIYTRLACSLATIFAGLMAAGMRKLIFDNKKPIWTYGVCIAVVCEVIHMILIFLTNMDNSSRAFEFVKGATVPMMLGNALAVGISIILLSIASHERFFTKKTSEGIAHTFQRRLLSCIVIAYLLTSTFTLILENGMAKIETQELFTVELNDVEEAVEETSSQQPLENDLIIDITKHRHVGTGGFIAVFDESFRLVSDDEYAGKHISSIGVKPPAEMMQGKNATKLYRADITGDISDSNTEYMYVFKFVEGYCLVAAMPVNEAMFMRDASMLTSVFMQVLIFATLFVFIYLLIKRVIINNLKRINNTLAQITNGDLSVTVDVRSNAEFASLSDDINSTVATLKRYIAEAAARIDKELEYAKQIQLAALPTNFPEDEDYDIYALMIAAKEVGGDFYDFYKLSDTKVAVLIADVSGKGIPAAMFMITAKTIIKDLAEGGYTVNEIFTTANKKLCENNESGMFVTAWMGILDLTTGHVRFANAGHNPPLLKRADGSFEYLKTRTGFVLAGLEGTSYSEGEITLNPGDRLFLYTDGVTEATNADNQLYGEDRLLSFMNRNDSAEAAVLLQALKSNIDEFVGEAPQFDDITMLMLDYRPAKGDELMANRTFPAKTEALYDVLAFVEKALESFACPVKTQTAICIAIEEVFVNVAHYAYPESNGDVTLHIGFDEVNRNVTFRMTDKGVPFNPLKNPDPDITLPAEERDIGGLGIFIARKTMDSLSYSYEKGENILNMIKKI